MAAGITAGFVRGIVTRETSTRIRNASSEASNAPRHIKQLQMYVCMYVHTHKGEVQCDIHAVCSRVEHDVFNESGARARHDERYLD